MRLAGALRAFERGPFTVTRKGASTYTNGRASSPVPTTFATKLVVQPVSGRELERLPEGLRERELLSVWSPVELRTGAEEHEPDTIAIDGATYSVEKVEPWDKLGGYWRAIAAKV